MLVPLLVLAGSTFFTFRQFSDSVSAVVEESLQEMAPVARLRFQVQSCRLALHHYVDDINPEGRQLYERLAAETARAFTDSFSLPFRSSLKREHLQAAYRQWQQAGSAARSILAPAAPPRQPGLLADLRRFEEHLEQAARHLLEVENLAEAEAAEELAAFEAHKKKTARLNTAIFAIGAGMALGIALLLARSVLHPLRELEKGARLLAGGDFAHRLKPGSADELGQLTAAFNFMAEQLEKDRQTLRDLSLRDPLTGLYNHREFFSLLNVELERARRYRHPLSVLMCDLDFFKQVNDTWGHPAGDQTLRGVAELIRREVRRVDHVARYGGEEFAAILPETAGPEALAMANRIRQAVAARPLAVAGTDGVALTVSIGMAVFPDDADGGPQLVARADQALYQAKREGRNRVCALPNPPGASA
jgi:diguanylate cyclase (GGDEF)-like protein